MGVKLSLGGLGRRIKEKMQPQKLDKQTQPED